MNWKTAMYLDTIDAQSVPTRKAEHDRTVRTLKDLITHAQERGDADMESLFRQCLATYEKAGYDL